MLTKFQDFTRTQSGRNVDIHKDNPAEKLNNRRFPPLCPSPLLSRH